MRSTLTERFFLVVDVDVLVEFCHASLCRKASSTESINDKRRASLSRKKTLESIGEEATRSHFRFQLRSDHRVSIESIYRFQVTLQLFSDFLFYLAIFGITNAIIQLLTQGHQDQIFRFRKRFDIEFPISF